MTPQGKCGTCNDWPGKVWNMQWLAKSLPHGISSSTAPTGHAGQPESDHQSLEDLYLVSNKQVLSWRTYTWSATDVYYHGGLIPGQQRMCIIMEDLYLVSNGCVLSWRTYTRSATDVYYHGGLIPGQQQTCITKECCASFTAKINVNFKLFKKHSSTENTCKCRDQNKKNNLFRNGPPHTPPALEYNRKQDSVPDPNYPFPLNCDNLH